MGRPHFLTSILTVFLVACGGDAHEGDHAHGPDGSHPAPDDAPTPEHSEADDHEHDEQALGTVRIGDHEVALAQGHGTVQAGKESHLVVKLPYSDRGETVVRAWLGTEDRTLSLVGKGEYAASHDDYDVHATAPDPLPEGCRWWVELELPDGTRVSGSVDPLME